MARWPRRPGRRLRDVVETALPKIVLARRWSARWCSSMASSCGPAAVASPHRGCCRNYELVGLAQYVALFDNDRWWVASKNLALFGGMFIGISLVIGVLLAILLDQRIRREGFMRTIYLYPMALSIIVTGTAWKWLLNPGMGLDKLLRDWGWEGFRLDWLIDPGSRRSIAW